MKTLFRNGSIHTMNGTEVVHSLLVEDGRILDVNCDVPAGECQVVDLHGKTVLPGFHDSHEHFLCYATDKEKINFFGIRSLEEMAERTRRYIADRGIKKGEWIQGGGWNENEFDVPVLPSRQDLDKFCPDNPAIFTRTCCSVAVANTAALKAAGIFDDIPTLQDGHIVVDENGVPTGMLHERARHLVYDILTKYTKEQLKQFILDYQKDLLSTGLTTVQTDDFKLWDATIDDILAAYEELDKEGKLNVRFIQQLRLITDAQLEDYLHRTAAAPATAASSSRSVPSSCCPTVPWAGRPPRCVSPMRATRKIRASSSMTRRCSMTCWKKPTATACSWPSMPSVTIPWT